MFDELLNILAIVERELGIRIWDHETEKVRVKRPSRDVKVEELLDLVLAAALQCQKCSYDLQGHVFMQLGNCPECGTAFSMSKINPHAVWCLLSEVIAEMVGRPADQIEKCQFLEGDLHLGSPRKRASGQ